MEKWSYNWAVPYIADHFIIEICLLIEHIFDMPTGQCLTCTCEGQQAIGNILCISMCVVLLRNNLLWFSSLKPQLMLTADFPSNNYTCWNPTGIREINKLKGV